MLLDYIQAAMAKAKKEQKEAQLQLDAERLLFEKEQAVVAAANAEREKENADRKKELEHAKQQVFTEQDRLKKVQEDIEAKARAVEDAEISAKQEKEKEKRDAETAEKELELKKEQDAADAAEEEARKPDSVKLYEYSTSVQRWLDVPELSTNWGKECLSEYLNAVGVAIAKLRDHLPSALTCPSTDFEGADEEDDDYDPTEDDDFEDVCAEDMGA